MTGRNAIFAVKVLLFQDNMKQTIFIKAVVPLLALLPAVAYAEVIPVGDARTAAMEYFQKNSNAPARSGRQPGALSEELFTLSCDGEAAIYVFNRTDGGFVIVSADDGTVRRILGYSDNGSYDPQNVSPQFKGILDSYVDGIGCMRRSGTPERQTVSLKSGLDAAPYGGLPASVDPLLGDIEWGQNAPFNRLAPADTEGVRCPAGCTAVAVAQIMMYHRWPLQGSGSNSYEWEGQTLSADFSHVYDWDNMLPSYSGSYTDEQADAVSRLLYDVGVAMDMKYNSDGSGAGFKGSRMAKHFDYDRNMRYLRGSFCSIEDWEGVIRAELAESRPVLCEGANDISAHMFVCDGYDEDGLFHYNYGWGGLMNGWFASSATGYDLSPSIYYGIGKNAGGTGAVSLMSCDDFIWDSGNGLKGNLYVSSTAMDDGMTLELALAVQNAATGQVSYHSVRNVDNNGYVLYLSLDDDIPDGSYQVYPVGRMAGGDWQTFFHNPLHQIDVALSVEDGVKSWTNSIYNPIDEGVTAIDGYYYILDETCGEAGVTRRNGRGKCYSGDVVIPDEVIYEGRTYKVTSICADAFANCTDMLSVTVGRNVETIDGGAFYLAGIRTIAFADGCLLKSVAAYAFNACLHLTECELPDGLQTIGQGAFQQCFEMHSISIPSTVTSIADYAFSGAELQQIRLAWTSPETIGISSNAFGGGDVSGIALYVPEGCADLYRRLTPWADMDIREGTGENNVSWNYDAVTATLEISGTGSILWSRETAPWLQYENEIRHLVIGGGISCVPGGRMFSKMPLESVVLCEGVKEIGNGAFIGTSLTSVSLPESLETIESDAFFFMSLVSITFPSNLKSIGSEAFSYCMRLSTIYCNAVTPPLLDEGVFDMVSNTGHLIVPSGSDYSSWMKALPSGWKLEVISNVPGSIAREDGSTEYDLLGRPATAPAYGKAVIRDGQKYIILK